MEKFNTMETEYKKSFKTIQALRGYITTLDNQVLIVQLSFRFISYTYSIPMSL